MWEIGKNEDLREGKRPGWEMGTIVGSKSSRKRQVE